MKRQQEEPSVVYQQFRELSADDRDTADAIAQFKSNRISPTAHQTQIDRIIQALPPTTAQSGSAEDRRSIWLDWLSPSFLLKPAMAMACAALLFFAIGYQKPYSWEPLVPSSFDSAGAVDAIRKSIGGTVQLGFLSQTDDLGIRYHLGKTSVQLALSRVAGSDSLMPYFTSTFEHIAESASGASYSDEIVHLATLLSAKPEDQDVADAISGLQQAVESGSSRSLAGFALGQKVELLRLALISGESDTDLKTLRRAGSDIASLDLGQWRSEEVPLLFKTLQKIQELAGGTYSLSERRQLMRYIAQLDVLLT